MDVPRGGNNDIICSITPSSAQAPGNYRMRIAFSQSGAPTPCGGFVGETEDFTITIGSNVAPVLNYSSTPFVNNLLTGQTDNDGFSIAQLLNGGSIITEANDKSPTLPAPRGIAIVGASTANGTWQYRSGNAAWTNIGATSTANALLLSDYPDKVTLLGNATRLRFVPTGPGTASLTFRAWDLTSGVSGGYGSAAVNGGTTAFSTGTETAQLTVSATAGGAPGSLYLMFDSKPTRSAAFSRSTGMVFHPGVLADTTAQQAGTELQVSNTGQLYWINGTSIYTSALDGTGETLVTGTSGGAAGLAAGDGHLFYNDYGSGPEIYRLSSGNSPVLLTGGAGQLDPAAYYFFDRMYYANSKLYVWGYDTLFMPQLIRMDNDGKNFAIIASPQGSPSSLKVVNDTAYWVETPDNNTYYIMRLPVSGAGTPAAITSTTAFPPAGMVADPANDRIYISGKRTGSITAEVDMITISTGTITQVLSTETLAVSMASNIGSASTPLPVKLIKWDARAGNARTAVLTWETAGETPGTSFVAERSADGRTFSPLGTVKGKGAGSYQLTDFQPADGTNYYRLAQVEASGARSYTGVRTVVFGSQQQPAVYPNPFGADGLSVILPASASYPAAYTILDMKGTPVSHGILAHQGDKITGSDIAPGSYLLSVGGYTFSIVKQ